MTHEIKVYIKAIHMDNEGHEEIIETKSDGEYTCRGNVKYILYFEKPEESGFDSTMIKVDSGVVSVIKKNKSESVSSKMVFEKGKSSKTNYCVAGGSIDMEFETEELLIAESENLINITLIYKIIMNGVFASKNKMEINVFAVERD